MLQYFTTSAAFNIISNCRIDDDTDNVGSSPCYRSDQFTIRADENGYIDWYTGTPNGKVVTTVMELFM